MDTCSSLLPKSLLIAWAPLAGARLGEEHPHPTLGAVEAASFVAPSTYSPPVTQEAGYSVVRLWIPLRSTPQGRGTRATRRGCRKSKAVMVMATTTETRPDLDNRPGTEPARGRLLILAVAVLGVAAAACRGGEQVS
jgi:hypothetical protein